MSLPTFLTCLASSCRNNQPTNQPTRQEALLGDRVEIKKKKNQKLLFVCSPLLVCKEHVLRGNQRLEISSVTKPSAVYFLILSISMKLFPSLRSFADRKSSESRKLLPQAVEARDRGPGLVPIQDCRGPRGGRPHGPGGRH